MTYENPYGIDPDLSLVTTVMRMKMRWKMVAPIHVDHDSIKATDLRHLGAPTSDYIVSITVGRKKIHTQSENDDHAADRRQSRLLQTSLTKIAMAR